MKKLSSKLIVIVMLLVVAGTAFIPQQANADFLSTLVCITNPQSCALKNIASEFFVGFAALIGNGILQMSAWFLSVAGIILNISIVLTMNIKAIYEATPAIKDVWVIIRNLSSIFIIFSLLFASISTILDVSKANVRELVGKIIIAGLLINFSLFFTKVAIDASNLVSLQFYRAIVPNSAKANINKDGIKDLLTSSFSEGGISDVFMSSLKITKIYNKDTNPNGLLSDANGGSYFKIAVSTFAGSALMIIAALSIFAASIAFIVRIVILLLLLGFSPLFFAGMIFPQVEKGISNKWLSWLEKELIFMPAYLLFLYVALRFISTINPAGSAEGFMAALNNAQASAGTSVSGAGILLSSVGIIFQYTIALILINVPLIVASQVGGAGVGIGKSASKWVSGKLKGGAGATAQHTIGRGAKSLQNTVAKSEFFAKNPNLAILANKTFGGVSKATFGGSKGGYEKRQKDYVKARTEFVNKSLKLNDTDKKNAVDNGIKEWDKNTLTIKNKYEAAVRLANDPLIKDKVEKNRFIKEAAELKVTLDARNKAEKEGKINKYLEDEALKKRKEQYASNLEKGKIDIITKKSRKEAAKAIRDEFNKSEEKKLNDKIKKIVSSSENEGGDKEEKEDKGGGDKEGK